MNKNTNTLSDDQLILLLQQDEEAAFDEIYNRYWSRIFTAAYKRVQYREIAEELAQDLFTSLWANRRKNTVHTSLAAYLSTSIKYIVLNYQQKELVRKNYYSELKVTAVNHSNATDETVLLHDLQMQIDKEVNNLPAKCKSVFELSRFEEKSMKEISAKLNISEKTVENHISRALKALKVSLRGFVPSLILIPFFFL
ncbi:RNA polymerase sigma-70 factor [Rhodocytophaga rosea]|uniref:RNA polymerase sigma-70 factor n=1 Tax=Rhodocytophaga rosea TaxID=2704465 RepID=A0A6C0GIH3_9BACT|nr:RNA polymerase sigma-70 factor [Rhodocytophaga rosea]QHT67634.1 RNA polymerase sigma-70 factor [Rhodocytophaga rosea]